MTCPPKLEIPQTIKLWKIECMKSQTKWMRTNFPPITQSPLSCQCTNSTLKGRPLDKMSHSQDQGAPWPHLNSLAWKAWPFLLSEWQTCRGLCSCWRRRWFRGGGGLIQFMKETIHREKITNTASCDTCTPTFMHSAILSNQPMQNISKPATHTQ